MLLPSNMSQKYLNRNFEIRRTQWEQVVQVSALSQPIYSVYYSEARTVQNSVAQYVVDHLDRFRYILQYCTRMKVICGFRPILQTRWHSRNWQQWKILIYVPKGKNSVKFFLNCHGSTFPNCNIRYRSRVFTFVAPCACRLPPAREEDEKGEAEGTLHSEERI